MAKFRFRNIKWKNLISGILVCALVIGSVVGLTSIFNKETKTIPSTAFSVGAVDSNGNYVESALSIYTKDLIECQGLTIEPDFEATGTYQVFYYSEDKNFIGSTDPINAEDGVYNKADTFIFAKYCRIMITPDVPTDEDGNVVEDFKIRFYEVFGYANDYKITVDKKQKAIETLYYGENKFVNNANSTASLAEGVDGFVISSGSANVSNLVYITDCTNICIKVNKDHLTDIQLYFHKQDTLHTSTTLDKFNFEKTFDGDFVYLVMPLSSAYAEDVAINLISSTFDMSGTEIYVW